jgi:ubiquinone biosynthesis monooxygenase Coq7
MPAMKNYSLLDKCCLKFDQALRALAQVNRDSGRENPAADTADLELSKGEQKISEGLMRINHTGEVCAQALYLGQGMTARLEKNQEKMRHAAEEEVDHLNWCKERLKELGGHTSYLNPLWFLGSFTIGAVAGAVGDKWSLGFVAETERQVVSHLESHMQRLPAGDLRSQAIIKQMREDENKHRQMAIDAGAVQFPSFIKTAMTYSSKVMTTLTYWI